MSSPFPSTTRILIIGASDPTSIGYACAQAFLQAKIAHVTIMARDTAKVESAISSLASEIKKGEEGIVQVSGVVGDLKKPETMPQVIADAVQKMGGLDVLVIGGGNGGSEYLGLDAGDAASYRMMHDVAVLSPLFLANAAAPELQKAPTGGTIVMISSCAPSVPWPDTAPFNLAKAAQNTLTETLAFKHRTNNIRVNGVLPACIHTGALDRMAVKKGLGLPEYAALRAEAHPMARNGTPEDVAQAVLFLASPASAFTTGELLKVDGGLHLSNWFNRPKLLAQFVGGSKAT